MSELPLIEPDVDLLAVLARASDEMLDPLVGYVLNKGAISSQLEITDVYKQHCPHHSRYWREIGSEVQTFGGNSVSNLFRSGHGVPYAEIVRDVASKVGAKVPAGADVETAEDRILLCVLEKAYERMSEEERRALLDQLGVEHRKGLPSALPIGALQVAVAAGGFASYQIAVIVANAVARVVLGRGLTLAANAALTRTLGVLAGPVGLAVMAIWTAIDLAGPAYRVTVPCVVQIAFIRQELRRRANLWTCPAGHENTKRLKFCGECGSPATRRRTT